MNRVNSDKRGDDKMIIQTGMRTDIPAFYSKWFLNRIKEGYVCVRNPYNPKQVTKYSLSPEVVDLIAFCTKNPLPMLPFLDELKPYGQYWFVTITPYGRDIEPNVPDKETVMEGFKELSDVVGADSMGWRYDPIFIDKKHSVEWHISEFEKNVLFCYLDGKSYNQISATLGSSQKAVDNALQRVRKKLKTALNR